MPTQSIWVLTSTLRVGDVLVTNHGRKGLSFEPILTMVLSVDEHGNAVVEITLPNGGERRLISRTLSGRDHQVQIQRREISAAQIVPDPRTTSALGSTEGMTPNQFLDAIEQGILDRSEWAISAETTRALIAEIRRA